MKKKSNPNKMKMVHLRTLESDEKRWRGEAERLGISLSAYIRLKCNLGVEEQRRLTIMDDGER